MNAVNFQRRVPSYNWLIRVQFALFPPVCTLCGARGRTRLDLCEGCCADLPWLKAACRRCAFPLPEDGICGRCLSAVPGPVDRVTAAFQYAAPLDALIMQLKYGARLPVGRVLGELMAEALMDCGNRARPDAILPVPLHPVRLRDRGFNQSAEIARPIAAALEIPIDIHTCVRVRNTAEQALLKAHERVRNLRDAFRVVRDPPYRHVAIVDDVLTTGSTVEALAWPLRMAGVETIEVWACARALTATN